MEREYVYASPKVVHLVPVLHGFKGLSQKSLSPNSNLTFMTSKCKLPLQNVLIF